MSETIVASERAAPKNAELDLVAYARAAVALTRMVRSEGNGRPMPVPAPAGTPPRDRRSVRLRPRRAISR